MKEYIIIFSEGTVVTNGQDNFVVRRHQVPDTGTGVFAYNGIVDCESLTTGQYQSFVESTLKAAPGMDAVRDY